MSRAISVILTTSDESAVRQSLSFLQKQALPFELFVVAENSSLQNLGTGEFTLIECEYPFIGDHVYSCLSASINDYVILNYGDVHLLSKQLDDCQSSKAEGIIYGEAPKIDTSYMKRNIFKYFFTRDINPKRIEHAILPFVLTRKFVNYLLNLNPLIWWHSIIDPSNKLLITFKGKSREKHLAYVKHFGFILLLLATDVPRIYLQRVNQLFFTLCSLLSLTSGLFGLFATVSIESMLFLFIANSLLWMVFVTFFLLTTLLRSLEISLLSSLKYQSRTNFRFRK